MRRIEADPEQARADRSAERRPLSVRSADGTTLHAEVFGPDDGADGGARPRLDRDAELLDLRDRAAVRARPAGRRLRPARPRPQRARGRAATTRSRASARTSKPCSRPSSAPTASARSSPAIRSARCRSPPGPSDHDVERRVARRRAAQHRRRRPDRRAAAAPACRRSPRRSTGDRGPRGSSARARRCRAFSTPVSHAMIRYIAFGPEATPAQVAFYERMLVAMPARRARRHRDRDLGDGSLRRAAAADRADDRDRRRATTG